MREYRVINDGAQLVIGLSRSSGGFSTIDELVAYFAHDSHGVLDHALKFPVAYGQLNGRSRIGDS